MVGDPDRADPAGDYVAATHALIAAFAEPGVLQRSFALPLLTREREFSGEQAVKMQLVDSVVHAWDLAKTLGVSLIVGDEITAPVVAMCEQMPDDESRRRPGAVFRPRVVVAEDATPLDRIVALLGRSPAWIRSEGFRDDEQQANRDRRHRPRPPSCHAGRRGGEASVLAPSLFSVPDTPCRYTLACAIDAYAMKAYANRIHEETRPC